MIAKLTKKDIIAFGYITLLSIIAVAYAFSIIPSPAKEQIIATDAKRVSDLSDIQTAVDNYYQTHNKLPATLDNLKTKAYDPSTPLVKTDPKTNQPYEYTVTSTYGYKLCATFATDSTKEQPDPNDSTTYPVYSGDFTHPEGHFCFTQKEQPPYNQPIPVTHPKIYPCTAGRMCPMQPSASDTPTTPKAILSSFDKNSTCDWTPTFYLTGFAPNSQITVYYEASLSDSCTTKPGQNENSSTLLNQQTDANGAVLVGYPDTQVTNGDYKYTFTDSENNSASLHISYDGNSLKPTIIPSASK